MTNGPSVTPPARAASSSVSTDTPSHIVPNLDHFVTQWMSMVGVSRGSAWNSSHDQRTERPLEPRIVKSHVASGVRGVGPAERTGKSRVSYCPGGRRPGGADSRRLWKPRAMNGLSAMITLRAGHHGTYSPPRGHAQWGL